jgi:hypothetical protein
VNGPDHIQRVGWQSWSLVSTDGIPLPGNGSEVPHVPAGLEWWNVTQTPSASDSANLPLDQWNPLLPHDTGSECYVCTKLPIYDDQSSLVSEISVEPCILPPHLSVGTMCKPSSTSEQDAIQGKWVRVEGNLNAQASFMFVVSVVTCTELTIGLTAG